MGGDETADTYTHSYIYFRVRSYIYLKHTPVIYKNVNLTLVNRNVCRGITLFYHTLQWDFWGWFSPANSLL
jgi:hypothetical protein